MKNHKYSATIQPNSVSRVEILRVSVSPSCACSFLNKNRRRPVLEIDFDDLIKVGSNLWDLWYRNKREMRYQDVEDVISTISSVTTNMTVKLVADVGGYCSNELMNREVFQEEATSPFLSIREALIRMRDIKRDSNKRIAAVFVSSNSAISIMVESNRLVWWIFDSHVGKLIRFPSLTGIEVYLKRMYNYKDEDSKYTMSIFIRDSTQQQQQQS